MSGLERPGEGGFYDVAKGSTEVEFMAVFGSESVHHLNQPYIPVTNHF